MLAIKGNRRCRILPEEAERRRAEGWDIYDDEGRLAAWSARKTVPWERYAALEARCAALEEKQRRSRKAKEE